MKDGTCPVGAVCKRSPVEDGDNDIRSLDARASVPFDTIRSGTWTPGKVIETAGLSVCSVMAVYDQNKWVMAHIPPSRASGGVLTVTGQDVIDEYKAGMTTKYNAAGMTGAQGYLLVSNLLDVSEQNSMQQWFNQNGINVIVQLYTPDQAFVGSGNFVISREAVAWPPIVTLT